MSNPTLFRTEAISKLSEAVKNIRSTQQTLQSSSSVRSKVYEISAACWYGSLKLVQDQLGVFVILSFGNNGSKNAYIGDVEIALGDLAALPISLNPESEVYQMVMEHGRLYIIGTDGLLVLRLANRDDGGLGLSMYAAEASYEGYCACIYGLIPDATLNEELSPQH